MTTNQTAQNNRALAGDHLAAFDRRNAEIADWRRLQPRLLGDVSTLSQYREATAYGRVKAALYLWDEGALNPRAETIKEAHRLVFGRATRDAGWFRKAGETIVFGVDQGAEPQRIPIEMQRLREEMAELLEKAGTRDDYCAAVAFYHARFIAIHPFLDGNGRVGRAVMEAQANLLGMRIDLWRIADQKPTYVEALRASTQTNDLAPLARIVAKSVGHEFQHEGPLFAAARVKCRAMQSLDDIKSLQDERTLARVGDLLPLPSMHVKETAEHTTTADAPREMLVAGLAVLHSEWERANKERRDTITRETREMVAKLGGSDLTGVPLRVAAIEFVRGETGLSVLDSRLSAHLVLGQTRSPQRSRGREVTLTR